MAAEGQLWFDFSYRAGAVYQNDVSIDARQRSRKKLCALRRSQAGDICSPDLNSAVITSSGKTELCGMEGNCPDGVEVAMDV
jgi:hypothetical protein